MTAVAPVAAEPAGAGVLGVGAAAAAAAAISEPESPVLSPEPEIPAVAPLAPDAVAVPAEVATRDVEPSFELAADAQAIESEPAAPQASEETAGYGGGKFEEDIEYVEGIGPAYGQKLKAINIFTPKDLLARGAAPKGRAEIAEQAGISSKLVLEWVNHCDLFRIKGVGSEYADLLEAAGVDTVVELAGRNPANLFNRMVDVNAEKNLVRRIPVQSQVEDWVAQAKLLPRVITY
jgi:predicted flap endonuclease-1-like 5' DNA nuclease